MSPPPPRAEQFSSCPAPFPCYTGVRQDDPGAVKYVASEDTGSSFGDEPPSNGYISFLVEHDAPGRRCVSRPLPSHRPPPKSLGSPRPGLSRVEPLAPLEPAHATCVPGAVEAAPPCPHCPRRRGSLTESTSSDTLTHAATVLLPELIGPLETHSTGSGGWGSDGAHTSSRGAPPTQPAQSAGAEGPGAGAGPPCKLMAVDAPTLWSVARREGLVALLPLALLAAVVLVCGTAGGGRAPHVLVPAGGHLLSVLWLFAALVVRLRQVVLQAGAVVPAALDASAARVAPQLSADVGIRYVQTCTYNAASRNPAEHGCVPLTRHPLHFLLPEIALFSGDLDGYVIVDRAGVIMWGNAALHQYLQYPPGALVEQPVEVLLPGPPLDEGPGKDCGRAQRPSAGGAVARRVVDRAGRQSTVELAVEVRVDPGDAANAMFIGRMVFERVDAVVEFDDTHQP